MKPLQDVVEILALEQLVRAAALDRAFLVQLSRVASGYGQAGV
jgi:hypothetical protein